jgi:hypothetical protein
MGKRKHVARLVASEKENKRLVAAEQLPGFSTFSGFGLAIAA